MVDAECFEQLFIYKYVFESVSVNPLLIFLYNNKLCGFDNYIIMLYIIIIYVDFH